MSAGRTKRIETSGKGRQAEESKGKRAVPFHHLIAVALIAAVALVAYSNTFHVPFHFDDRANILENSNVRIKTWTWDRVERLIRSTYKETIRVVAYLTFALNYTFGEFNVFGYHLVNLLVHVAAGVLLYAFLMLTLNLPSLRGQYGGISYKVALFTALIFVAHPIQTQAVTYIVQRMASMAGMLYLLAMILYIRGRLSRGYGRMLWFGGSVLTYLVGVFTKENVAILPFFVALYEFYFFQGCELSPGNKRVVLGLVTGLVILGAAGLLVWGRRYMDVIVEGYQYRTFTMGERVLTQFRIVLYYVTLLVYPHPSRLNLDYDFPVSRSILDPPTTLISILMVAGLLGYSLWAAKKRPLVSYCILWYFGNLVIESSIFPLELVFEHRLYLPCIGPFLLFSLGVIQGLGWVRRKVSFFEPAAGQDRGALSG